MKVEIVRDVEGFDALRYEWNEAAEANLDANVFLTWEWLRTWWRHFGEGSPGSRLDVVVLRDGDGIVAAAPWFMATVGWGPLQATRLQQIGWNAGDYGGILLVRDCESAVDQLVAQIETGLGCETKAVVISRLASDSVVLPLLRSALAQRRGIATEETIVEGGVCPFADVTGDYDLQRRLRKNRVPQRLRRLREKYDVAFEYRSGSSLEVGLEELVDLHRRRWEDRPGEFKGLLADAEGEAFLLDAVHAIDDAGWLRLLTLTADGRAIATRLDFEFGGRRAPSGRCDDQPLGCRWPSGRGPIPGRPPPRQRCEPWSEGCR